MATHIAECLNNCSSKIKSLYNLLVSCKTPQGFLSCLHQFINTLEAESPTQLAIESLRKEIQNEDQELVNAKTEAKEWMLAKLTLLKKNPYSQIPHVKQAIENACNYLLGKEHPTLLFGNYFSMVYTEFEKAVQAVACYNNHEVFDGWTTYEERESTQCFNDFTLQDFNQLKIKSHNEIVELFQKKLNKGFIHIAVYDDSGFFSNCSRLQIQLTYGHIKEIKKPSSFAFIERSYSKKAWLIQNDTQAHAGLRFLSHLSMMSQISQECVNKSAPRDCIEAEILSNNNSILFFLNKYRSDSWKDAPIQKDELLAQIDRLLIFLSLYVKKSNRGRPPIKNIVAPQAEDYIQAYAAQVLDDIPRGHPSPITEAKFVNTVLEKAPKSINEGLRKSFIIKILKKEKNNRGITQARRCKKLVP